MNSKMAYLKIHREENGKKRNDKCYGTRLANVGVTVLQGRTEEDKEAESLFKEIIAEKLNTEKKYKYSGT